MVNCGGKRKCGGDRDRNSVFCVYHFVDFILEPYEFFKTMKQKVVKAILKHQKEISWSRNPINGIITGSTPTDLKHSNLTVTVKVVTKASVENDCTHFFSHLLWTTCLWNKYYLNVTEEGTGSEITNLLRSHQWPAVWKFKPGFSNSKPFTLPATIHLSTCLCLTSPPSWVPSHLCLWHPPHPPGPSSSASTW